MSFWDNVKNKMGELAHPYDDGFEDEEDEIYTGEDDYPEEQPSASRSERRRANPFDTVRPESASTSAFNTTSTAAAPERSTSGFSGQVVTMGSGKQEVILFHAKVFKDAAKACEDLRKKKAVILNMENMDKALTRRVVDFLSGSVFALDGKVKKIAQAAYLFIPHNMEVSGDLENVPSEDSYV